ncbi:hypothetical protein [Pontibacter sp. G13]|uniref:hypothetical protein n=1 Tax=Pontibacter sp. G13 TaxID=3074898 RepID=UPI00288A9F3C|nr:hypothetical protein [Pontibacter sp. G13]WNJ18540.1 hypothetical protein RJD25_27105 [Pontibacter sp. G13]
MVHADPWLLNLAEDRRRGISLIWPIEWVNPQEWLDLQGEMKALLPEQYHYPLEDLHLTVLTIISCVEDYAALEIKTSDYVEVIRKAFESSDVEQLVFEGLAATHAAWLMCGYSELGGLERIRARVRKEMHASGLYHTMDKRYLLNTAHSTLGRFQKEMDGEMGGQFWAFLQKWKFKALPAVKPISKMQLVENDWYMRRGKVNVLESFSIG